MVDTVIKLIAPACRYQDEKGIWRTGKQSEREIFARESSVGMREFFAAGEAGIRAEHQFMVFAAEYHGEETCVYDGVTYAIYRTYHVPGTDMLELYVKRKVGVNNG